VRFCPKTKLLEENDLDAYGLLEVFFLIERKPSLDLARSKERGSS
jgi:hypothetical protein